MNFQPQTEQEIKSKRCLPPGEYDFEVSDAADTTSKKGNDMIAIQLRVFAPDGSTRIIRDWLLPSMEMKLNRFTRATGLESEYQSGELSAFSVKGVNGRCVLTIQGSEGYGDQNTVRDYLPAGDVQTPYSEPIREEPAAVLGVSTQQTKRAMAAADDDDIPF
jgi:hypothetical protein